MQVCSKKQLWKEAFTSNLLRLWDVAYPTMGPKDSSSLVKKHVMSKSHFPWLANWVTPTSCCLVITSPIGQEVSHCVGNSWNAAGQGWHSEAPWEATRRGWLERFTKFHQHGCKAWYLGWSLSCSARGWEIPGWGVALLKETQGHSKNNVPLQLPCLQSKQKPQVLWVS